MKRRPHPDRDLGRRDQECRACRAEGQRLFKVCAEGPPAVRAGNEQAWLVLGALCDWREGLEGALHVPLRLAKMSDILSHLLLWIGSLLLFCDRQEGAGRCAVLLAVSI